MSFSLTRLLFDSTDTDREIFSQSVYWVFHAICDFANEQTMICTASRKSIGKKAHVSTQFKITQAIQELERLGLISVESKVGFPSVIKVNIDRLKNLVDEIPSQSTSLPSKNVDQVNKLTRGSKEVNYPPSKDVNYKHINKHISNKDNIFVGNSESDLDPRVNFGTRVESQEDIPWDESEIPKIEPELFELETPKAETPKTKKKSNAENLPLWEIVDKFNEICVSFPKVRLLSDKRKSSLKSRIKDLKKLNPEIQTNEQIVAFFADLFRKIESIDWWKGKDGGWQLDFNFILNPEKFVRLCEGSYFNKNNFNQPNGNNNGKSNQTWGCAYDPNRSNDEVLGASELGYKIVNGAIKF